jgi:hypothetical protein
MKAGGTNHLQQSETLPRSVGDDPSKENKVIPIGNLEPVIRYITGLVVVRSASTEFILNQKENIATSVAEQLTNLTDFCPRQRFEHNPLGHNNTADWIEHHHKHPITTGSYSC